MIGDRGVIRASAGLVAAALVAACSGGGGSVGTSGGGTIPSTATPGPVPIANTLQCTQAGAPQAVVSRSFAVAVGPEREMPLQRRLPERTQSSAYRSDLVAISYPAKASTASSDAIEQIFGSAEPTGRSGPIYRRSYGALGRIVEVRHVDPQQGARVVQALRASGLDADFVHLYRPLSTSASSAFPNDPYFDGFQVTEAPTPGASAPPPTYGQPPLYESASVPGQWDMHAICAANAWAYGQTNSTGHLYPNATGNAAVNVAVVDTGVDPNQPELRGKLTYVETDVSPVGATTPAPAQPGVIADYDGHGTNVAGIAAASTNDGIGFAGVGYNTHLMAFGVFPSPPPGGCSPGSTDPSCSANSMDIAQAIDDAVRHGANVINLSLGGSCPDDTIEGTAVENAIASGVVVVAASGNDGQRSGIDAPACDNGVIAVGASAIGDGVPTGTAGAPGSASSLYEYVAGYSNAASSIADWGLVAPGGDPAGNTDSDDLHWIENIYSSTGEGVTGCTPDYPGTGAVECRILIAGTSQATPHVAGAAALLYAVAKNDLGRTLTPAQMFSLLCTSARNIGDSKQGCGRLDVYRAMAQLVGDPSP